MMSENQVLAEPGGAFAVTTDNEDAGKVALNTSSVSTVARTDIVELADTCSQCENKEICKFADEYTSYIESLDNDEYVPLVARVNVKCKFYKPSHPVAREEKVSAPIGSKHFGGTTRGIQVKHTKHASAPIEPEEA